MFSIAGHNIRLVCLILKNSLHYSLLTLCLATYRRQDFMYLWSYSSRRFHHNNANSTEKPRLHKYYARATFLQRKLYISEKMFRAFAFFYSAKRLIVVDILALELACHSTTLLDCSTARAKPELIYLHCQLIWNPFIVHFLFNIFLIIIL